MADKKPKVEPKKPATPMPPGIARDMENMRKDRMVDDEYKGGEKARKESMGKIGFNNGGTASSRADGCAIRGKTRGMMR